MITLTPTPDNAFQMMVDDDFEEGRNWLGYNVEVLEQIDDAMDSMRAWVRNYDAMDLWEKAQKRHVAIGAVHDIEQACASPQFEHREFFSKIGSSSVRQPGRLVRFSETPSLPPQPPKTTETPIDVIVKRWSEQKPMKVDDLSGQSGGEPLSKVSVFGFDLGASGPVRGAMQ